MITAGVDIGSEIMKVVIMENEIMLASRTEAIGAMDAVTAGELALGLAMVKAGITKDNIRCIATTGLSGIAMPSVDERLDESACICRGAIYAAPSVRTVLDLGAFKSVAVRCDSRGIALKIVRNDNCATGTGKYLSMICKVLGIAIEDMADLAFSSKEAVEVESTCTVFAESEVISLLHQNQSPEDIARGALKSLAKRVYPLLVNVGMTGDVMLAGGVAQNRVLVAELQDLIGRNRAILQGPREISALGAALIARKRVSS